MCGVRESFPFVDWGKRVKEEVVSWWASKGKSGGKVVTEEWKLDRGEWFSKRMDEMGMGIGYLGKVNSVTGKF